MTCLFRWQLLQESVTDVSCCVLFLAFKRETEEKCSPCAHLKETVKDTEPDTEPETPKQGL